MYIKTKLLIFDSNLIAIRKSKVALKFNKPTYTGMCILELSKVLMYQLHDGYITNKYGNNSRLLFTDTGSLMYEFNIVSKWYDNSNKLVNRKMKDEPDGVAVEEFVALKPNMYSFLVDNSGDKKAKGVNNNVVATINHYEYKYVF